MGILLGLLTAVVWGGSDFLARFATRRIGTLRAMLYMQLFGFVLLTIFLPWLGGWGHLADGSGWRPWAWGVLAGLINAISTIALYRSFEIGKMSVVAPLSASYPVLTVVLSLITGDRLTMARAVGISCTLVGVVLVAAGERPPEEDIAVSPSTTASKAGTGILWAICSAIGFGVLFFLLGRFIVPRVGSTQTVWLIRLTCTIVTALVILLARQPLKLARDRKTTSCVTGMAVLDTSAYVFNNMGMLLEQVSVVSVLASLYGAITVALAAIFLREHVSRWQWLGIVSIFAGIYLIGR